MDERDAPETTNQSHKTQKKKTLETFPGCMGTNLRTPHVGVVHFNGQTLQMGIGLFGAAASGPECFCAMDGPLTSKLGVSAENPCGRVSECYPIYPQQPLL